MLFESNFILFGSILPSYSLDKIYIGAKLELNPLSFG